MSDGDEVLFAFHEIPSAKQKERTSAWMFFAGAAFLVCVGGVSLVGASSSVAPGLSQDPMSFTSTRTAGLSFKDLFVIILDLCVLYFSLKRTALVGTFQNCDVEQARLSEVQDCAGSVQGLVSFKYMKHAHLRLRSSMNGNVNQVKVPLLSEPQGDWFTSQPATPACFCR